MEKRGLLQAYKWWRGYSSPPWGIDVVLTDACNLRCSYCPLWGDAAEKPSPVSFMDTGSALRFVDEVAAFRPMLRLFGGEPFLHPEWKEIVDHATDLGLCCTAVSNGVRLEKEAERMALSGIYAIGISLDADSAANDESRGLGSFEKVRQGILALQEAKRQAGKDTPLIEIYTTVHEGTYSHLADWAAELRSWDIHALRIQHLIWCSSEALKLSQNLLRNVLRNPTFFRSEEVSYCRDEVPAIDGEVLLEQVRALKEVAYPFRIELHPDVSPEELRGYYSDPRFLRRGRLECTTMENYAFLDPCGRLYPCLSLDMGNVFETSFHEVWNGRPFRAFRRLIRREKRLPFCHRCPD